MTQQTETPRPWSVAGFTLDERRRKRGERRQNVLALVRRKLTITEISREAEIHRSTVTQDVNALIADGLLTRGEVAKGNQEGWSPTTEMVILIWDMLRARRSYKDIAKECGIHKSTLSKWCRASTNPRIIEALKERAKKKTKVKTAKVKKRAPKKKANRDRASNKFSASHHALDKGIRLAFGISAEERNAQNKSWMHKNGYYPPKVPSTNRFTITVPSRYKRHPDLDGVDPPAWLTQWQARKNG